MNDTSKDPAGAGRLRPAQYGREDIFCLSHLRWDFVYQRPQHLLTRGARRRRVFFFEEPVLDEGPPRLATRVVDGRIHVMAPYLPRALGEEQRLCLQRDLVEHAIERHAVIDYVLWYYTPMALPFTRHLTPAAILYDCMDELSAFLGAPPGLREREAELIRRADVMLTGGQSLYEAKRALHPNVHALPSSVDVAHFARAQRGLSDPDDQASIPRPRLGFFGVIDERMDLALLSAVAAAMPQAQLVLIGPVVKIDEASLPRQPNIHYLGPRAYAELPAYIAGWDVALLPFAKNEATRFISPTKTPEYLAAGKPVVSTSIRDVVRPYGELGLVRIADTPGDFAAAIAGCLEERDPDRLSRVARFLERMSWDWTWARVDDLLRGAVAARRLARREGPCSTT